MIKSRSPGNTRKRSSSRRDSVEKLQYISSPSTRRDYSSTRKHQDKSIKKNNSNRTQTSNRSASIRSQSPQVRTIRRESPNPSRKSESTAYQSSPAYSSHTAASLSKAKAINSNKATPSSRSLHKKNKGSATSSNQYRDTFERAPEPQEPENYRRNTSSVKNLHEYSEQKYFQSQPKRDKSERDQVSSYSEIADMPYADQMNQRTAKQKAKVTRETQTSERLSQDYQEVDLEPTKDKAPKLQKIATLENVLYNGEGNDTVKSKQSNKDITPSFALHEGFVTKQRPDVSQVGQRLPTFEAVEDNSSQNSSSQRLSAKLHDPSPSASPKVAVNEKNLVINFDNLTESEILKIKSILNQRLQQLSSSKKEDDRSQQEESPIMLKNPRADEIGTQTLAKKVATPVEDFPLQSVDLKTRKPHDVLVKQKVQDAKLSLKVNEIGRRRSGEHQRSSSRDEINSFVKYVNQEMVDDEHQGRTQGVEKKYPDGLAIQFESSGPSPIPIIRESESPRIIEKRKADENSMRYSDMSSIEHAPSQLEIRESKLRTSFLNRNSQKVSSEFRKGDLQDQENLKQANILLLDHEEVAHQEERKSENNTLNASSRSTLQDGSSSLHDKPEKLIKIKERLFGKKHSGSKAANSNASEKKLLKKPNHPTSEALSSITSLSSSRKANSSKDNTPQKDTTQPKTNPEKENVEMLPQNTVSSITHSAFLKDSAYLKDDLTYSKRTLSDTNPHDLEKSSEYTGPNLWQETLRNKKEFDEGKDTSNILQTSVLRESIQTDNNTSATNRANIIDNFPSLFNTVI